MKNKALDELSRQLEGELHAGHAMRVLYATDASAYRELPLAVALPRSVEDLKKLIWFARENKTSLIPRTAGTSLAGQVVGKGIVVDVSRYFTQITELNASEQWVTVQPGVIRDELNMFLKPHGLFFAPETSTANRAMIGGMIGNNSCGSNSVVYGSVRDHLISIKALLSDGTEVEFKPLTREEFFEKLHAENPLERKLYEDIHAVLSDEANRREIKERFPKPHIDRRNTGYALDLLMDSAPFGDFPNSFNFSKLIAGSEGTLAFITEAKLYLSPLPPPHRRLICAHFSSINEALQANLTALKFSPSASELIDKYILDCTKSNIEQSQNRFFIEGDPEAILVIELSRDSQEEAESDVRALVEQLKVAGLGYHYPVLLGSEAARIWSLRKAGLGLLSNIPGDAKPVPVIEDTAVDPVDLPDYIAEFNQILKKHSLHSVHYGHAGSGELHLRPIINLKTKEGNRLFRVILEEIATLVRKYQGSLSGEHGDGRLRGEFIEFMIGKKNFELLKAVKESWDPDRVFNPGKIVDTPAMNTFLRYEPEQPFREIKTLLDFSSSQGILRAAEQCNGSGDCRKTELTGGIMCPSYMATRNEQDTTRARANILREMLTRSEKDNPFNHKEIHEVMDLCISCKGCKLECPSNVDMAKLKAEFLYQYYKSNRVPLRSRLVADFPRLNKVGAVFPVLFNFMVRNEITSTLIKALTGFAQARNIPQLYKTTLFKWFGKNKKRLSGAVEKAGKKGRIIFFCDEFSNYSYNDVLVAIKAIELLSALGYQVEIPRPFVSGRTYISKGLLKEAKQLAAENVGTLCDLVDEESPLVGIEPSALLTFRDEYIDLLEGDMREKAKELSGNALLVEEFIVREMDKGNIKEEQFTSGAALIKLHGHCHQRALSSIVPTKKILSLPENFSVQLIPSGCCGMAGSFGYEKERYDMSMKMGEMVLFPAIRKLPSDTLVVASGTSCRHQIKDGTGKQALHPIEVLWDALRERR